MGTTPQLAAVEGGRWGRGEGGDVKGWVWFSEGAAQQLAARDATRSGWGGRRGGEGRVEGGNSGKGVGTTPQLAAGEC